MTGDPSAQEPGHRGFQHWLGFLGSGLLSFGVDAGVMEMLTGLAGWRAQRARLISIPCAMVVGWLAHRRFTFAVATPPSLAEFLRFAAAASSAALLNYAIFWSILAAWPDTEKFVALVIATAFATAASYLGYRFGAFRTPKA